MIAWPQAITFAALWDRAVVQREQHPFLVFERPDGEIDDYSYGVFDEAVGDIADVLIEAGVRPGDSIHLALANSPWFVGFWLAAARIGAWIVPSDPASSVSELAHHRTRTRPVIGVYGTDRADVYRKAAATGPHAESGPIVGVDESQFPAAAAASLIAAQTKAQMTPKPGARDESTRWPVPELRDRLAVMFTSGTTGDPKGVEITQANYAFTGMVMAEAAGLAADDRQLVVLPLFHANAQYYSFASAIWAGASVGLVHRFSASGFVPSARRLEATHASLFAAPIRMILAKTADGETLSLRHCWFAQNLSTEHYDRFATLAGCRPRQLYGMTETIPAVLTDRSEHPRPDVMGTPTPPCKVEVRGTDLLVGGEPGITLFAGYLDDPTTTAASFDADGWFVTGDHATIDADGNHHFAGRRSDVLKVAGENVSIVEVETVLAGYPGVLEVAVVGAPDAMRDEVPIAYLVAEPDVTLDLDALTEFCTASLSKPKRPRELIVVDELPRTSVGKIKKFLLAPDRESSHD